MDDAKKRCRSRGFAFSSAVLWAFLATFLGLIGVLSAREAGDGGLLDLEVIEQPLPFHRPAGDHQWFMFGEYRDRYDLPPMQVLLSRHRYWAQDGHMDVVVVFDEAEPQGELHVRQLDERGDELAHFVISPLPGRQFIFYPALAPGLSDGAAGEIELKWMDGEELLAEHREGFRVERYREPVERTGRVRLELPNVPGARQQSVPVTAGVPFPRGIVQDSAHIRLVDEHGVEVPLQVMDTARWSKFGTLKWILCDFTVDLDGGPRELFLEYGPEVRRSERATLQVESSEEGFPVIDAGRLRFDDGLRFDAAGDGDYVQVLDEAALSGAFVEHEDGRLYRMPAAGHYEIEEHGPEKLVVKREGWYREENEDREFCKYVVRYVIHRDSPVMRIFHTWIFTGDGNRDRIANMGWDFKTADGFTPEGFLSGFGEQARWLGGDYLLQYDYEHFDVAEEGAVEEFAGGRAAGAASVRGNGVRLYFGAKDFWQNYPSEMEFADGSLWFHNWPRHNRAAGHTFEKKLIEERGEPAASSSAARYAHEEPERLTRSEWLLNALQLRFAHEGEMLDFRLPQAFGRKPLWSDRPAVWQQDDPEAGVNAQGVSRTEEMWLLLTPEQEGRDGAVKILEALNEETLRAVVDPAWVAQSGAFHEIHHQDMENYPEQERIFELLARAPALWQEKLGMYGMWLHGDLFAWGGLAQESMEPSLYRALRKGHHGWPYSWAPYGRSGDSRLLKAAQASTRQIIDASYNHYVSDELARDPALSRGSGDDLIPRQPGLWRYGPLPWSGMTKTPEVRYMTNKADHLIHSWYLTGYHRARDNLLCWGKQSKLPEQLGRAPGNYRIGPRDTVTTLKSWMETYEATFDPWFLVAAHVLARGHRKRGPVGNHVYNTGNREFLRYSGCPKFEDFFLELADHWGDPRTAGGSWGRLGLPVAQDLAFAWHLTGRDYYLRRTAHFVDWVTQAVYDAHEPWYVTGQYTYGHGTVIGTSYILRHFPAALGALAQTDRRPVSLGNSFRLAARPTRWEIPEIIMLKEVDKSLAFELAVRAVGAGSGKADYQVTGPEGDVVFSGVWDMAERKSLELDADAPAGEYRLSTGRFVDVPVSILGTREVMRPEPGERLPSSSREARYWFKVPEGVEKFYIESGFPHAQGRVSVWNPDGELVWNGNYYGATHGEEDVFRADIEVETGQAGRLWRVTVPGHGGGPLLFDPQIPRAFATDRDRWFMPEELVF